MEKRYDDYFSHDRQEQIAERGPVLSLGLSSSLPGNNHGDNPLEHRHTDIHYEFGTGILSDIALNSSF